MPEPLEGLRVPEFARILAGPRAGQAHPDGARLGIADCHSTRRGTQDALDMDGRTLDHRIDHDASQ